MSELITDEIFTDAQQRIAASNMNGIIGRARIQPDVIANKVASATLDVADQFLVLKTDNTLAKSRFDTFVNSTSSTLPLADSTKNGMLRQLSGKTTDFVDGTNACQPLSSLLPPGVVTDFAGPNAPAGWLPCAGGSYATASYPALFAAIGYTYGGSGANFNVPNFVGRFPFWSGALGSTGGAGSVALGLGHLPNHTHPIADQQHGHSASSSDSGHTHTYNHPLVGGPTWGGTGWTNGTDTSGVGYANITTSVSNSYSNINTTQGVAGYPGQQAFSIIPPYLCVIKIIKI